MPDQATSDCNRLSLHESTNREKCRGRERRGKSTDVLRSKEIHRSLARPPCETTEADTAGKLALRATTNKNHIESASDEFVPHAEHERIKLLDAAHEQAPEARSAQLPTA